MTPLAKMKAFPSHWYQVEVKGSREALQTRTPCMQCHLSLGLQFKQSYELAVTSLLDCVLSLMVMECGYSHPIPKTKTMGSFASVMTHAVLCPTVCAKCLYTTKYRT